MFDPRPAKSFREVAALWREGIWVTRGLVGRAAAVLILTPVVTALSQLPFMFVGAFTSFVAASPAAGDITLRSIVPIELPTLVGRFTPQLELWAALLWCAAVSVLLVPALLFGTQYLQQRAKQSVGREIQAKILANFMHDASRGIVYDPGEIALALQSYAGMLAGLLTNRLPEWLKIITAAAQAAVVLWSADLPTFLLVAGWASFFCFVLPAIRLRKSRRGAALAGAAGTASGPVSSAMVDVRGASSEAPQQALSGAPPEASSAAPLYQAEPEESGGNLTALRAQVAGLQIQKGIEFQNALHDLSSGLPTIVSLQLEDEFLRRLHGVQSELDALTLRSMAVSQLAAAVTQLAGTGGLIALLAGILAKLPAGSLINSYNFANAFVGALQRVESSYAMEIEASAPLRCAIELLRGSGPVDRSARLAGAPGIRFEDVTVEVEIHGRLTRILDRVSFELPPGRVAGLVGASGSGKSSIHRVLSGLVPITAGRVTVGDTTYGPGERVGLLASATVIAQFSQLFRGTVRENILLGCPDPVRTVEEALALAGFDDGVEQASSILARRLEPPGRMPLSGGEQKRVMLARALVRPLQPVLLIDEVDSGLDEQHARMVLKNIVDWAGGGATALIITHHPQLLPCEVQLVMERGRCGVRVGEGLLKGEGRVSSLSIG